ncbi:MAG: TrbI/VirB10 family protein [Victivallales bacterium]
MIDSRKLISFLKSPVGKLILFLLLTGFILVIVHTFIQSRNGQDPEKTHGAFKFDTRESRTENIFIPFNPRKTEIQESKSGKLKSEIKEKPEQQVRPEKKVSALPPSQQAASPAMMKPFIPPIAIYGDTVNLSPDISEVFAPYGRIISCELVLTIDSSSLGTPIIALVTEDLWHDGKIIIPAGTEMHGTAANARTRDRIGTSSSWVAIWRTKDDENGKELRLSGIALDKAKSPMGSHWDITDGSAGIRGRVIDTTDMQMLVALASEFLSGVGKGLSTQSTYYGSGYTQTSSGGTVKDALSEGLQDAAQMYAKKMLETISKDGSFVRCPAGTRFYLYVTQTIDMADAMVGGSKFTRRTPATSKKEPR